MRRYKLNILQVEPVVNELDYLKELLSKPEKCITIIQPPRRKSIRSMPNPGIKWIDGIIQMDSNENCDRAFLDLIQRGTSAFKIARLKIEAM